MCCCKLNTAIFKQALSLEEKLRSVQEAKAKKNV